MAASYYQEEEKFFRPLTSSCDSPPSPPPMLSGGRCTFTRRTWFKFPSTILTRSKAAILILLWNTIVGFTLAAVVLVMLTSPFNMFSNAQFIQLVYFYLGMYGGIAFLQMLCYPLGGLLADLRCGRYRTVMCSMVSLWCGYLFLSVMSIVYIANWRGYKILLYVLGAVTALLTVFGFTGFQANVVQFGLDQLQDVPSGELSVFLHWFAWMDSVGIFLARMLGAAALCNDNVVDVVSFKFAPHFVFLLISILLLLSCCKRGWFHREPHTQNPYGTVYRVLRFAAKRDRPLRPRSAFAYCDDERPTRIEFAKQRFGGPFTTETVEDVKTFLRILVMLVAIGPVYILQVVAVYVFPLFGMHIGPNEPVTPTNRCHTRWLLLQSDNLSYLTAVILMPLYIVFIHPHAPRWFPRILYRLGLGIVLLVLSVASMLVIEGTGHMYAHAHNISNIPCMFLAEYRYNHHHFEFSQTLELNTLTLLVPNFLTGIATPLIYITILEFISAQSPHTMKGLLLGVFYAIRGFFIVIGCLLTIPFVQEGIWKDCDKSLNCGFYYYLMNTVLGAISIVLFWRAARWYQYRVREDRPYEHNYVEEYYSRYARRISPMASPEEETLVSRSGVVGYGTTTPRPCCVEGDTHSPDWPPEELPSAPDMRQPGEPLPPQCRHLANPMGPRTKS